MRCPTCHRTSGPRIGHKAQALRESLVALMSAQHALCPDCGFPTGGALLEHNGKCEECRRVDLTEKRTTPMKLEACR